jgi:hypothetical protein
MYLARVTRAAMIFTPHRWWPVPLRARRLPLGGHHQAVQVLTHVTAEITQT